MDNNNLKKKIEKMELRLIVACRLDPLKASTILRFIFFKIKIFFFY